MEIDIRRSHWETQHYKWKRDDNRAKRTIDNAPKWGGVAHRWAGSIWHLASLPVASRAVAVRIIWDKHWTLRNQWIHTGLPWDQSCCRLCGGGLEDQDHILRGCMHPDMQACRRRHVATIRAAIRRAIESGDELARLMETYFELATGAGVGYLAWTGLLPPQSLEALEQVCPKMNESERGRFVKFGTLFANT